MLSTLEFPATVASPLKRSPFECAFEKHFESEFTDPQENSLEADPVIARRLQALREQLRKLNRRSSGPFSHQLARRGPLSRLRDHICDLSRLADAAILSAESAHRRHSETLVKDLRLLLKALQSWTERLENQIWRLESQSMWSSRLDAVFSEKPVQAESITRFCNDIARETLNIPSGLLLLPEPGLPISATRQAGSISQTGTLKGRQDAASFGLLNSIDQATDPGWSVEQIRMSVFSAGLLLPEMRAIQVATAALQYSAHNSEWLKQKLGDQQQVLQSLPANDSSSFVSLVMGAPACDLPACDPRASDPQGPGLSLGDSGQRVSIPQLGLGHDPLSPSSEFGSFDVCQASAAVLQKIQDISLAGGQLLVPPSPADFYGQAYSLFGNQKKTLADQILRQLGIVAQADDVRASQPLPNQCDSVGGQKSLPTPESTILTHKLRWHGGDSLQSLCRPKSGTRMGVSARQFSVVDADQE